MVTIGASVGYDSVVNGAIVISNDSGIGLVGHWPLRADGPECPDGHRGCAQSLLTTMSITERIGGRLGQELSYDQCLALALGDDPVARAVVDGAGRGLGRLLAAVGNLVVPHMNILAGERVGLANVARLAVDAGVGQDRSPRASGLPYVVNDSDATQWCRGAAAIAIQANVVGGHPAPAA